MGPYRALASDAAPFVAEEPPRLSARTLGLAAKQASGSGVERRLRQAVSSALASSTATGAAAAVGQHAASRTAARAAGLPAVASDREAAVRERTGAAGKPTAGRAKAEAEVDARRSDLPRPAAATGPTFESAEAPAPEPAKRRRRPGARADAGEVPIIRRRHTGWSAPPVQLEARRRSHLEQERVDARTAAHDLLSQQTSSQGARREQQQQHEGEQPQQPPPEPLDRQSRTGSREARPSAEPERRPAPASTPDVDIGAEAYPRLAVAVREGQRWWPHLADVSVAVRAARAAANAAALTALAQAEEAEAEEGPKEVEDLDFGRGCSCTSSAAAAADADISTVGGLAGRRRGLAAAMAAVLAPEPMHMPPGRHELDKSADRLKRHTASESDNTAAGVSGSAAAGGAAGADAATQPSALITTAATAAREHVMLSARCRPVVWLPDGRPAAGLAHPPLRAYLTGAGSRTASAGGSGAVDAVGGGGGRGGPELCARTAAPVAAGRRLRFSAPTAVPGGQARSAVVSGGDGSQDARAAELALLRCPHPGWAVRATLGDAGGGAGRYWWPGVLTARRLGAGVTSLPLEQPYMAAWFRSLLSGGGGGAGKAPQQCQVRVQVELDGVLLLLEDAVDDGLASARLRPPATEAAVHLQHPPQQPQQSLVYTALLKRSSDVPSGGRVFGVPPELLAGRYVRGWRREAGRRSAVNHCGSVRIGSTSWGGAPPAGSIS
ncbi:hypothetical protein HYH02_014367 [Chlamydomonas schloesseri]|uniref:Uncharacterized protein n=1 Tax=Chlamydomonas schloesseri TaxID=2026947 RepID=A0A835VWL4_9CHLO|nr:hypothetical protein HYH02_014367 [Chlamydomonas schloesseri]|eukprot:KAG2428563.1 hypothetical protein HYH02_014367 [Chlamydomonas schloesseri]